MILYLPTVAICVFQASPFHFSFFLRFGRLVRFSYHALGSACPFLTCTGKMLEPSQCL